MSSPRLPGVGQATKAGADLAKRGSVWVLDSLMRKNLQALAATEWKNTLATTPEVFAKRHDSLLSHK